MGRVIDPKVYVDGELDDTIQSVSPSPEHDKAPVDTITATGEAAHVDEGNRRYPLTVVFVPVAGRDYSKWDRWVDESVEDAESANHTILIENESGSPGNRVVYERCHWTKVDQPVGKGANTWTVTGFARKRTRLQAAA